jgi:hypothetical protein
MHRTGVYLLGLQPAMDKWQPRLRVRHVRHSPPARYRGTLGLVFHVGLRNPEVCVRWWGGWLHGAHRKAHNPPRVHIGVRRACGLELADSSSRHMARSQQQTAVHAQMPQTDSGSKRHVLRRQSGDLHRSASEISSFSLLAAVRRGEIVYRLRAGGISPRTSPTSRLSN